MEFLQDAQKLNGKLSSIFIEFEGKSLNSGVKDGISMPNDMFRCYKPFQNNSYE